jgi:hypothetical protein
MTLLTYLQSVQTKNKYFEDFDSFNPTSSADPITEWLTSPTIPGADGLMWWSAMEASGHPLSRMGLNFLSAPGMLIIYYLVANLTCLLTFINAATSTDVERAFSKGGLTVSKMRHSLSDESTRAACVLGSWCDFPGAVPRDDIMTAFKDKSKWDKSREMGLDGAENLDRDRIMIHLL